MAIKLSQTTSNIVISNCSNQKHCMVILKQYSTHVMHIQGVPKITNYAIFNYILLS